MIGALVALAARGRDWLLGFFETRAPQSMARLCALIFAGVGVAIGATGVVLALRPEERATTVEALAKLAATFVAGGTVALLSRSKPGPPPAGA